MARASAAGIRQGAAEMRRRIVEEVLPRAGKIMGDVIAREARLQCISSEVRSTIKVRVETSADGKVRVFIETRGKGSYMAPWLEYSTAPHWIGLRNLRPKKQALRIGDRFVAAPVWHPGAQAIPFLRPAFDLKMSEAFAAGQRFIDRGTRRMDAEGDE